MPLNGRGCHMLTHADRQGRPREGQGNADVSKFLPPLTTDCTKNLYSYMSVKLIPIMNSTILIQVTPVTHTVWDLFIPLTYSQQQKVSEGAGVCELCWRQQGGFLNASTCWQGREGVRNWQNLADVIYVNDPFKAFSDKNIQYCMKKIETKNRIILD